MSRRQRAGVGVTCIVVGVVVFYLARLGPLVDILSLAFTAYGILYGMLALKPEPRRPQDLAEQLAVRVKNQYDVDVAANDLNETPLLVHWTKAPDALVDRIGAAIAAADLTGSSDEVRAQYLRIPSRRWVVLGEGGAGKSALMLTLMLELLKHRTDAASDGRVPVLLPLSAWDPAQPIQEFVAAQLISLYPGMRLPAGAADTDRGALMLELIRTQVLPVFDGLDEMDSTLWAEAITRLSKLSPDCPFVLTSRPAAFRQAVEDRRRPLAGAAVVELRPVGLDQAQWYLTQAGRRPAQEWTDLLAGLRPTDPLAEALATPLMVWLAGAYDDPLEHLAALPTKEAVTNRLIDELIPAKYAEDPHWRAEDVERWLGYLASEVERGRPDNAGTVSGRSPGSAAASAHAGRIAWWRLADAAEPHVGRVAAATALLTTGGAAGLGAGYVVQRLAGPGPGIAAGVFVWLLIGGFLALSTRRSVLLPTTVEVKLGLRVPVGLVAGGFIGVVAGGAALLLDQDVSTSLVAGAGFGIPLGLVYGMTTPVDTERATSPAIVLQRERAFVLAYFLAYGLATGILGGVLAGNVFFGVVVGLMAGLAGGLFNGVPWLVVFKTSKQENVEPAAGAVAWFRFLLAKLTWLGSPSKLPWRLMTFLENARGHGVLMQVGATYAFRHQALSKRLALNSRSTPATPPDPRYSPPGPR